MMIRMMLIIMLTVRTTMTMTIMMIMMPMMMPTMMMMLMRLPMLVLMTMIMLKVSGECLTCMHECMDDKLKMKNKRSHGAAVAWYLLFMGFCTCCSWDFNIMEYEL